MTNGMDFFAIFGPGWGVQIRQFASSCDAERNSSQAPIRGPSYEEALAKGRAAEERRQQLNADGWTLS